MSSVDCNLLTSGGEILHTLPLSKTLPDHHCWTGYMMCPKNMREYLIIEQQVWKTVINIPQSWLCVAGIKFKRTIFFYIFFLLLITKNISFNRNVYFVLILI